MELEESRGRNLSLAQPVERRWLGSLPQPQNACAAEIKRHGTRFDACAADIDFARCVLHGSYGRRRYHDGVEWEMRCRELPFVCNTRLCSFIIR